MIPRMTGIFLTLAAVVLLVTASAKAWSLAFPVGAVSLGTDPVFGVDFRKLLSGVILLEIAVAILAISRPPVEGLFAVGWLSMLFGVYRLAAWQVGWKGTCGCLGALPELLRLSFASQDSLAIGVLAFLFIGSATLLPKNLTPARPNSSFGLSPKTLR